MRWSLHSIVILISLLKRSSAARHCCCVVLVLALIGSARIKWRWSLHSVGTFLLNCGSVPMLVSAAVYSHSGFGRYS